MAHGLSCSTACGLFPDQGSNPVFPALAGRFLTTAPPGKPGNFFKNEEMHLGIAQSPRRIKEKAKFSHMRMVVVMEVRGAVTCKPKDISQLGSIWGGCG